MKKNLKKVVLVLALLLPGVIKAQEFNVTAKADFVSDYIWRGAYQNSGFSVQPTLGLSYGNLSLSAWGSQSLTKTDGAQEFDINLSYTIGGLGITVTDYWWNGITMPYGDYKHDHHFEGTLAYNFGENVFVLKTANFQDLFSILLAELILAHRYNDLLKLLRSIQSNWSTS